MAGDPIASIARRTATPARAFLKRNRKSVGDDAAMEHVSFKVNAATRPSDGLQFRRIEIAPVRQDFDRRARHGRSVLERGDKPADRQ